MAEDSTLQSDYLRTGNLDSLKAIKDQQWAARAALEALYTRELDLVEVEGLLHLGLKATESPSEDTQQQLLRSSLLDLSSRTECFKVFTSESSSPEAHPSPNIAPLDEDESGWGLDIGDDDDEEEHHSDVQVPATSSSLASLPLSLFDLLTSELSELGLLLAQNSLSATLSDFFGRFALPNQHILRILDTLPLTLDAATLVDLFQRSITGPRQKIPDWAVAPSQTKALDIDATQWYLSRVRRLDIEAGLIDQAFLLVQHAASRGVSGLDEVGEELSLLCKLVYDRPQTPMSDSDEDWTLDRWHQSDPVHLFDSYLAHSSPSTIVHDIRRLALPYAFVLEAKAERAGQPQPDLHNEMLRSWMLSRVTMHPQQLDLAAAIIRASKPDLSPAQRLIKSDEELARISLSLVYGCSSTQHWSDMSAILDCMPALQSSNDTTPAPNFVATAAPGPIQLYLNISSFSSSQISRAMDALDVHLEQAELLARWQTPVRLSWLIQHASDAAAQRKLLNQLSSNATRAAQKAEDWLENQDDWESLMEDLVRMAKPETEIEPDLLPAFGQLSKDEVLEVFFKTLLRSGGMWFIMRSRCRLTHDSTVLSTAKSLLSSSSRSRPLDPVAQEKLCLDVSRELYNNANTANLHGGDMKQAYDW